MPALAADARGLKDEVEAGFARDASRTEAQRCYLCHFKYEIDNDLCIYCDRCLKVKPVDKCIVKVSSLVHDAENRITGFVESKGPRDYNMLFIDQSQCIRCGACRDVCPVECITLQKAGRCMITEGERT
jgi:ferredoxin